MDTRALGEWLVGAAGQAAVAGATAGLDAGRPELTVATALRREGLDPERAALTLDAASTRRRARATFPDAEQLLLTREALEQASDPLVSAWRAARIAQVLAPGGVVLDLCAGAGGDTLALAAAGLSVRAVERDPLRAALLAHNARTRNLDVEVVLADLDDVEVPRGAIVHVDPSRRRDGRRVRRLRDHEPEVPRVLARVRPAAAGIALTLSPAVDLDDPDLPADAEVGFVQRHGELHETTVWLGVLRATTGAGTSSSRVPARASATLLPEGLSRLRAERAPRLAVGPIGAHLIEVAPAAVRARLHDELGAQVGARRVATRRALLSVDTAPPPSPWYRSRAVQAVLPARPPVVRRWLRAVETCPVELVLHGFEADLDAWWRALGRPPRGPDGRRIELIRTDDGAFAVVTDAGRGTMVPWMTR